MAACAFVPLGLYAQDVDCRIDNATLPQECVDPNAEIAVSVPAEPNTEWDRGEVKNADGFVLAIDGEPIDSDPRIEDRIRQTDLALEKADIRVSFDGLGAKPRLDMYVERRANGRILFESRMNYPAFTNRAEIRIIDPNVRPGGKTIAVIPIKENGQAEYSVPSNSQLIAVHRVYDARGRYDETYPVRLDRADDRRLSSGVEEGSDNAARRRIPIRGGAVTVSSNNANPGAAIATLGETVRPDAGGNFVIQRILPPGEHDIAVRVAGSPRESFNREVEVPNAEWFYIGIADVTAGWRQNPPAGIDSTYQEGRLAFTVDGVTASGARVTVSADTKEEPLEDLFRNIDRKDANSLANRIDPGTGYQVYGDDSRIEDRTPTSGNFYARIERDNNFALWGDFKGRLSGNSYIRNERSLYGAQAEWNSQEQTAQGEARTVLQFHAAQPDTLPGREVFRGTGGSIYFLQHQDLTIGSETLTLEVRDALTSRVVDRVVLQQGRDYSINYIQGTILLTRPLTGSGGAGVISTLPGGDQQVNLVAQYEFTPTATDVDGLSYGARAEHWLSDNFRIGVTATSDTTGTADQNNIGADLLYRWGKNSSIQLDYARTDGPGFGSSFSNDGGLIIDTNAATAGSGRALSFDVHADFADLGISTPGFFEVYAEDREEGFSTLDHTVTATTGDERLWGFAAEGQPRERFTWALSHDSYSNDVGHFSRRSGVELSFGSDDDLKLTVAAEHLNQRNTSGAGRRTDVALRADWQATEALDTYAFAQVTASNTGLDDNDRYGVGLTYKASENWTLSGEISDGDLGFGGRILAEHRDADNASSYFGYELDPALLVSGSQRSEGRYIAGGRRKINDQVEIFGENTFDLFGEGNSLTNAYGVSYRPTQYLTFDAAYEGGRIEDSENGDFDRHALSFGATYQNEALTARGKLEYRTEDGVLSGSPRDAETFLLSFDSQYKLSEEARLQFSLKAVDTRSDETSFINGELLDVRLGYAFRPIDDDKLNFLLQYRYLDDSIGQSIDGTEERAPQVSQVLSADVEYDLNEHWTIGGKIGYRMGRSAPDASSPMVENRATLGVLRASYHVVHKWDLMAEARVLDADLGGRQTGFVATAYRHVGNNLKIGVGYNFGNFSDDLTDLSYDDKGPFINLIAKF